MRMHILRFYTILDFGVQQGNNSVIKKWRALGINSKNSFQTQALLQLKNEYCNKKLCLSCSVGCKLLKNETR